MPFLNSTKRATNKNSFSYILCIWLFLCI